MVAKNLYNRVQRKKYIIDLTKFIVLAQTMRSEGTTPVNRIITEYNMQFY